LPQEWAQDSRRRREAGVPEEVEFATKPPLARRMLERAFEAGVPVGWVVGDSIYGDARGHIGVWLEEREQPFVFWVSRARRMCGAAFASTESATSWSLCEKAACRAKDIKKKAG
jgi:SRSO17 transposase